MSKNVKKVQINMFEIVYNDTFWNGTPRRCRKTVFWTMDFVFVLYGFLVAYPANMPL